MTDLWPTDLVNTIEVNGPVSILKEQASLLGAKTKNIVKAKIERIDFLRVKSLSSSDPLGQAFNYAFAIYAPALGDYRYRLFEIHHDIDPYPVRIVVDDAIARETGIPPEVGAVANHEEEFKCFLSKILGSTKTRQVIQTILSQSTDEAADNGNVAG